MKEIRLIGNRIVVEPFEEEVGEIIISDTAKEKPQQSKVAALGSVRINKEGKPISLSVKKGDVILFPKYTDDEIRLENVGFE